MSQAEHPSIQVADEPRFIAWRIGYYLGEAGITLRELTTATERWWREFLTAEEAEMRHDLGHDTWAHWARQGFEDGWVK